MNGLILSEPRPDAVCPICKEGFTEDAFTDAPQDREKQAVSHFIENKQAGHDPFHQECIQEWMKMSSDCPYDRLPIYHSYADNPHFNWLAPLAAAAKEAIFAASLTLAVGVIPILATETLEFQDASESFFSPPDNSRLLLSTFISGAAGLAANSLTTGVTGCTLWTLIGESIGTPRLAYIMEGFDVAAIASDAIGFGLSGTQHQFHRSTPYSIANFAVAPITQCANWMFNRMALPEIGRYNIATGVGVGVLGTTPLIAMTSTTAWFVSAVVASGISTALISLRQHFNAG